MARRILKAVALIVLSIIVIFPLFYMLSSSLFRVEDFRARRALLFSPHPELKNYARALEIRNLSYYIRNSILTSVIASVMRLVISTLAAFAFSHLRFKGKRALLVILLSTLFIPSEAVLYQNYETISALHLLDSVLAIVLPLFFSASQLILLISAFSSVDRSYYDAAQLDGCRDISYILFVLMPLSMSMIITILMQTFITTFNAYLWPLLVTNRPKARTIQIALTMLGFATDGEYGAEMAAIALVVMPFVLFLALGKKYIEKALTINLMRA